MWKERERMEKVEGYSRILKHVEEKRGESRRILLGYT